ncbi:MAG: hypothetical protein KBD01_15350 [Acidobacteria bacterium]|nr:hypothetical protein [Acidobacteriota bacterium]
MAGSWRDLLGRSSSVSTLPPPVRGHGGTSQVRDADVRARIEAARDLFEREPRAALAELARLREQHANDPFVLHALCLMKQRSGDFEGALELAREALAVCLQHRQGLLAADILEEIEADATALGVPRHYLVALGSSMATTQRWQLAVRALGSVLMSDPAYPGAARELEALAARLRVLGDTENADRIEGFVAVVRNQSVS